MIRWVPYAFLRIAFFFTAGILLAIYWPGLITESIATYASIFLALLYAIIFALRRKIPASFTILGIVAFTFLFFAGYAHLLSQTEIRDNNHFGHRLASIDYYTVNIAGYPEDKEKSWKVVGEIRAIHDSTWHASTGKVLLYFRKQQFVKPFRYGDQLLIKGHPQMVTPPANPGEFDYKRFLSFRNIYHQHFIGEQGLTLFENKPSNYFVAYAIEARTWADGVLHHFVNGAREQAIASALVLGVTDGLDNELLNTYAATGAMHVLAVSGLHITIIYLIIVWFLTPLNKSKRGKWVVAGISLVILWGYAFVTGLTPSVLRAVTMFTFICVAKATSRNTNIYNTLAASAFLLLVYDPYLIMSVGFQLSYIAVLGIVYIQPLMYQWWEPKRWLTEKTWSVTCVSIAAQLATFALGMLYFHQFPNYFLLSNLLVIPISFGVLVLGILLLVVSWINAFGAFVGLLLTWCIKAMNACVAAVEWLPYSLVENIYITTTQCWLLMIACITLILMAQRKRFYYLILSFGCFAAFAALQWLNTFESSGISKISIYRVSGHSAIDFIDNRTAFFLSDTTLINDQEKIRFHIKPNRTLARINRVLQGESFRFIKEVSGGKLMFWKNTLILHITGKEFCFPGVIHPDLVIISNNAVADLSALKGLNAEKIIFDSSNAFGYAKRKMTEAERYDISAYNVLEQGAFEFIHKSKS